MCWGNRKRKKAEVMQNQIDELRYICATLVTIMLQKGIMTEKEYETTKAQCVTLSDQIKANLMGKWEKENPEEAKILKFMEKLFGEDYRDLL